MARRVNASSIMAWLEDDVIRPVPWQKRMAGGLSPAMMAAETVERSRCARRMSMASLAPQISACWELSTCGRAMLHAASVVLMPSDPFADLRTAPAPAALCPCTRHVAPSKVISRHWSMEVPKICGTGRKGIWSRSPGLMSLVALRRMRYCEQWSHLDGTQVTLG